MKQQIKNMKKLPQDFRRKSAPSSTEKIHEMNAANERKRELKAMARSTWTCGLLKIVRKYSDFEELSLEILQEFIDKIVVSHKENIHGEEIQNVEISTK